MRMFDFFKKKPKPFSNMEFKDIRGSYYRKWCNENLESLANHSNTISSYLVCYMWIRSIAIFEIQTVDLSKLGVEVIDLEMTQKIAQFELGCWSLSSLKFWISKNHPKNPDIYSDIKELFILISINERKINKLEIENIINSRIKYYEDIKLDDDFINTTISSITNSTLFNVKNRIISKTYPDDQYALDLNRMLIDKQLMNWIGNMLPTSIDIVDSYLKEKV